MMTKALIDDGLLTTFFPRHIDVVPFSNKGCSICTVPVSMRLNQISLLSKSFASRELYVVILCYLYRTDEDDCSRPEVLGSLQTYRRIRPGVYGK